MLTIEQVRPLYQNDSAHDFDHVLRVLVTAERIGQTEGADMAILRTAVLLHDIARAEQNRTGQDHAIVGAQRATDLLTSLGYPAEFVQAVSQAIASHRFRADRPPKTLEAKILYDADKLDAIGAIGIARAFAFSGSHNRALWDETGSTTLQEFQAKLVMIKDKLFTLTARQIAEGRHQFMEQFIAQINAEIKGQR